MKVDSVIPKWPVKIFPVESIAEAYFFSIKTCIVVLVYGQYLAPEDNQ